MALRHSSQARFDVDFECLPDHAEAYVYLERACIYLGMSAALTPEEFKLILSCLHPDREASEERKTKAFAIFVRLDPSAESPPQPPPPPNPPEPPTPPPQRAAPMPPLKRRRRL